MENSTSEEPQAQRAEEEQIPEEPEFVYEYSDEDEFDEKYKNCVEEEKAEYEKQCQESRDEAQVQGEDQDEAQNEEAKDEAAKGDNDNASDNEFPFVDPKLPEIFLKTKARMASLKKYGFDTNVSRLFLLDKLPLLMSRHLQRYELPVKSTDKAELEEIPFDWLPPLKPYKPMILERKDKEGNSYKMQRVVGFRELLNKRSLIRSFKEQEEIEEQYRLRPPRRMWGVAGWRFDRTLEIVFNEVGVGYRNRHLAPGGKKKLTKTAKKATTKKSGYSSTISSKSSRLAGRRRPVTKKSAVSKSQKSIGSKGRKGKSRKSPKVKSVAGSTKSSKLKAVQSKTPAKGGRRESIVSAQSKGSVKKSTAPILKKAEPSGKSDHPKRAPSLSVPSHIYHPKDVEPKTVPKNVKKESLEEPPAKPAQSKRKSPKPASDKKQEEDVPAVRIVHPEEEIIVKEPEVKKVKFEKRKTKHRVAAKESHKAHDDKKVTFVEPQAISHSQKDEDEDDTKDDEELKRNRRKRKATLTAEEIELIRKHELHLERDAEWLELSASDKEEEERLRAQTFGKEKLVWMNEELSYESQLLSRELRVYTVGMDWAGRQPFHTKDDFELGIVQYLVDRKKQIPFAITSLSLWIATVFVVQGFIDVSIETNVDNIYTWHVEKAELEKFRVPLVSFMANLFLASIWSITALLKDGLFICQYMNSLMASLSQMEVSGAVGIRNLAKCNYAFVAVYAAIVTIAFAVDWPTNVRGGCGLISMMLFRSVIQNIRVIPDFIYFQIFGLFFHIYVIFCARGIFTLMQLLASVLLQAAQKWNYKFGAKFGQFGIRSRGHLIRLKLHQSLIKIFVHHRFIVGLTAQFGRVFATPIATYFGLQLSVLVYFMIYLYRYRAGKPEDFRRNGGEFFNFTDTDTGISTLVRNYNTKAEDYVTTYWVILHSVFDFMFTSESIAAAGHAVITGFEFVRRKGQILCDTSHERRLIQSLQWSFSATSAAVINVNNFFAVNRQNILSGLGTALVMFSLIIQLNQERTILIIAKEPCGFKFGRPKECFVIKRVPEPVPEDATPAPPFVVPPPPIVRPTESYETFYWFWEDCMDARIANFTWASDRQFNFSSNMPICFRKFHKDETDFLRTAPPIHVAEPEFNDMLATWNQKMNPPTPPSFLDQNCIGKDWRTRLRFNFHLCFSRITMKFLLLEDVFVCPSGCPTVWLRALRNNTDCVVNPYPISPFFTNGSSNGTKFVFREVDLDQTTGLTRLGYFDCNGNETNTLEERDDCGWIPLQRIDPMKPPILEIVNASWDVIPIPDGFGKILNTSKFCYTHNMLRCRDMRVKPYCPWANFRAFGFDEFEMGYLYGADCYNSSLFFTFQAPDHPGYGLCSHLIPKELIDNVNVRRFVSINASNSAKLLWDEKTYSVSECIQTPCTLDGMYDLSGPPCQLRNMTAVGLSGFEEARDFRRECRYPGVPQFAEIALISQLFRVQGTRYIPISDLEAQRAGNNCWLAPYPTSFVDASIHFDCWGNAAVLDDCGNLAQPFYAGPFYHDSEIERIIRAKQIVYVNLGHLNGILDPTDPAFNPEFENVSRICYRNKFSQDRCVDTEIFCTHDGAAQVDIAFYAEDCDIWNVTKDEYGVCIAHLPRTLINNITHFPAITYTENNTIFFEDENHTRYNFDCIHDTDVTISSSNMPWRCLEAPGFFDNHLNSDGGNPPAIIRPNGSAYPCHSKRNHSNCAGAGTDCTLINPLLEVLNFRLPCRDRNNVTRAMIPRFLYLTKFTFPTGSRSENWVFRTVPMQKFREDNNLNCWENPVVDRNFEFIYKDLNPILHPMDPQKGSMPNPRTYSTCWDHAVSNDINNLDSCGWWPHEEYATGREPQPPGNWVRINITVNITQLGREKEFTRSCFRDDPRSIERCNDNSLICHNEQEPVRRVLAYGFDCRRLMRQQDVFGSCLFDYPLSEQNEIIIHDSLGYSGNNGFTVLFWRDQNPQWYNKQLNDPFCTTAVCRIMSRFAVQQSIAGDFPCAQKVRVGPGCLTNLCRQLNAYQEAIHFRLGCRNANGAVRGMIPRLLFTFRTGAIIFMETVPVWEYRRVRGFNCWDNPFSFLNGTNATLIWEGQTPPNPNYNPVTSTTPFVSTCWGENVTVDKIDDCGWFAQGEYPTGRPPLEVSTIGRMNHAVMVTRMNTTHAVTRQVVRSCYQDVIAEMRCKDPNLVCRNDESFFR